MKKFFFVLAFAFCCSVAFAAEEGKEVETPKTTDPEGLCVRCAVCYGKLYCVVSFNCETSEDQLNNLLGQNGCGKPNSVEIDAN